MSDKKDVEAGDFKHYQFMPKSNVVLRYWYMKDNEDIPTRIFTGIQAGGVAGK